MIHTKQADH